jgi:hypothetical protein
MWTEFRKRKVTIASLVVVLLLCSTVLLGSVSAQSTLTYLNLEGEVFAGNCNLRFYETDGSRVSTTESIRFMAAYFYAQDDDWPSLLMSGDWASNTSGVTSAIVMGWTSRYGPYADYAAWKAHNCSACNVSPDYFWIVSGQIGDYSAGWFNRLTSPYMLLDGIGLGVDWGEETVESFGQVSMRGRIALRGAENDTTIRYWRPQIMVSAINVDGDEIDEPGWSAYTGRPKLSWLEDGATCMESLLGDYAFICDWLYAHFGIDICPEGEPN